MRVTICRFSKGRRLSGFPAAAALALLLALPGSAAAGDYSFTCATPDGQYVFNDGVLNRASEPDPQQPVAYEIIRKIPLSDERGVCESTSGPSKGGRFKLTGQTFLLTFLAKGEDVPRTAYCELAASGLPASANCDRETLEKSWSAFIANASGEDGAAQMAADVQGKSLSSSLWKVGQSTVRIYASGNFRRGVVETAGPDLKAFNIAKGHVLFFALRKGRTFSGGTLYLSHAACGRQEVPLTGTIADNDLAFTISANAPVLGTGCRGLAREQQTFRFRFLSR